MKKPQRNDPCPCGSGKKYKHCCANTPDQPALPSLPSLLATALPLHQAGQLDQAAELYGQILARDPKHFDALHLLGVIEQQRHNHPKAVELIEQATSFNASNPFAFSNLGAALIELGQLDRARQALDRALALKPDYAQALCNLGNVHKQLGNHADAARCYQRASLLSPDTAELHNNIGAALLMMGRLDEALGHALKARQLDPSSAEVFNLLGNIYKTAGQAQPAIEHYRQAVALNPAQGNARHFLALMTGEAEARPPDSYIETMFDDYAGRFDHHLQKVLNYRIPQILAQCLLQMDLPRDRKWDALDLGCGTGLAGLEIAPHARRLVGVDLSARMLAKAAHRGIYHHLVQSDLQSMLRNEADACYDLAMAADVFVYVGRLEDVVEQVARALRPGAFFAFSVESCGDSATGYQLQVSGRYAHARGYLNQLAQMNGFEVHAVHEQTIRSEGQGEIPGWLAFWRLR